MLARNSPDLRNLSIFDISVPVDYSLDSAVETFCTACPRLENVAVRGKTLHASTLDRFGGPLLKSFDLEMYDPPSCHEALQGIVGRSPGLQLLRLVIFKRVSTPSLWAPQLFLRPPVSLRVLVLEGVEPIEELVQSAAESVGSSLTRLSLDSTSLTDASARAIACHCSNLELLSLKAENVTESGINSLTMTSLCMLRLADSVRLLGPLPGFTWRNVRNLSLHYLPNFDHNSLMALLPLQSLVSLHFHACPKIDALALLPLLRQWTARLEHLQLESTDDTIVALAPYLRWLKCLYIVKMPVVAAIAFASCCPSVVIVRFREDPDQPEELHYMMAILLEDRLKARGLGLDHQCRHAQSEWLYNRSWQPL